MVSQAEAAQRASSVLQVAEQQLPVPLRPQTPDWHMSLAVQAWPSPAVLFPVVLPPATVIPPVVAGPVVVPLVLVGVDEPQADPKKRANPAAAVIAFRMCKTSFVNASRGLPNAPNRSRPRGQPGEGKSCSKLTCKVQAPCDPTLHGCQECPGTGGIGSCDERSSPLDGPPA